MYIESVAVTLMGLIALTVLRRLEDKNDRLIERHVTLELDDNPKAIPDLMALMSALNAAVAHFNYQKEVGEKLIKIDFDARFPVSLGAESFIHQLEERPGLKRIQVGQRRRG